MSQANNLEAFGMPIPTDSEVLALQAEMAVRFRGIKPLVDTLAEIVIRNNRLILDVIDADIAATIQSQQDTTTDDEQGEYSEGLNLGYSFIVGAFSYVQYLREGYGSTEGYAWAVEHGFVRSPMVTYAERDLAVALVTGNSVVDPVSRAGGVLQPTDLKKVYTDRYFTEAPSIEQLQDEQMDQIVKCANDDYYYDATTFLNGFRHGVGSAITMHVAADEAAILERARTN